MSDKVINCNHNHPDCFAWYYGTCQVLCEQICDKECPFYKTRMEYDLGNAHKQTHNPRIEDVIKSWEERMGRCL